MGKAEEAAAKRKTKAARKRLRRFPDSASHHEAVIAAKRRRKAGRRRICEGMCFTLPTPEDPFNERSQGRRTKKKREIEDGAEDNVMVDSDLDGSEYDSSEEDREEEEISDDDEKSSMLSQIANLSNGEKIVLQLISQESLTAKNKMRCENLWEACQRGLDIIGNTLPAISYVYAAINHIARQPPKARLSGKPIALFLVENQQEALSVRNLCKPLKASLGIQTVSIHPGTSIQHQVEGLKSSMFHILIATPERLSELLTKKALNLLHVSFLVVANVDALIQKGFKEHLEKIKLNTNPTVQMLMFSEKFSEDVTSLTREYVDDPITRLPWSNLLKDKAACIAQDVSIIIDDTKKLPKVLSILRQHREGSKLRRTLILAKKDEDVKLVANGVRLEGYKTGLLTTDVKTDHSSMVDMCENFSNGSLDVLIAVQDTHGIIDLSTVEVLINYDFPSSMEDYCKLLTSMARNTVYGILHTFCECSTVRFSQHLVDILKDCSQNIPTALQMLANAAAVVVKS